MTQRIVVAGAGYSGVLAAVRAAKLGKGSAEVTLVNDRDTFVERVRLHEEAVHERKVRWPLEDVLRGSRVVFRQGMVLGIDPERRVLLLNDGELEYDRLILALGSSPDLARLPPGARENALIFGDNTTAELSRRLRDPACRAVTVCGGGLVGVELAGEIAESFPHIRVSLVTDGEVAPLLYPEPRLKLKELIRHAGINLYEHTRVAAVESNRIVTGTLIEHDLCVAALGMQASPVAKRSNLPVNQFDQVLVDAALRALDHPNIYVAGDAAWAQAAPGSRLAMGCKYGMPMAAQAAANAVASLRGDPQEPFDFEDTHFIISVGRKRALVYLTREKKVLTGRLAVLAKEVVTRSTLWSFRWERHRWFNYPYVKTGRVKPAFESVAHDTPSGENHPVLPT